MCLYAFKTWNKIIAFHLAVRWIQSLEPARFFLYGGRGGLYICVQTSHQTPNHIKSPVFSQPTPEQEKEITNR